MSDIRTAVNSTLRGRGAPQGNCGVLLLEDAVEHSLGQYVWRQIISDLLTGAERQHKTWDGVQIIGVDWTPRDYKDIVSAQASGGNMEVNVVDCCSDPLGWIREEVRSGHSGKSMVSISDDLKELRRILGEGNKQSIVILDSLTTLLIKYSLCQVLSFIAELKQKHAGLIMRIYKAAHHPQTVKAFECVSSTFIEMRTPTDLQKDFASSISGKKPHGSFAIKQKTQAGRVSVNQLWFNLSLQGTIISYAPPEDLQPTAQQVAAAKNIKAENALLMRPLRILGSGQIGKESSSMQSVLANEMEGKMKLMLTGEEQKAKAAVTLPYEKQWSGETGSGEKLGEIVYYRDSEEDCDSDEDPDDDLDI